MSSFANRLHAYAAIGVLLGMTLACGGGGGGGGGPTNPPLPPGISFNASSSPTPGSCYLSQGGATNPNRLFLDVRVNDVDDWYGVAFDLRYPSNLLDWVKVTEGGFLPGSTSLEVTEVGPGHLVVGHTRLGNVPGKDGSGILMTLEFVPVGGNGSGQMSFENAQAFRTNSFPQTADFIAGTVNVSP